MTRLLPPQPDLDHLKNEAKSLYKIHARHESTICEMLRHLHRFADANDDDILSADVALTDIQFALALDYGFNSWEALRQAVLEAKAATGPGEVSAIDELSTTATNDIRINFLRFSDESRQNQRSKQRAVLGLDIGSSSVRLLELSKDGSTYRVESYGIEPLPKGAVVEKNLNDVEVVGEAIARLVQRSKPTVRDVAVALAGTGLITKTIEMPRAMSDEEHKRLIDEDADHYLPWPLDDVALDFEVRRISPRNEELVEILLAGCIKKFVDLRTAVVELGGLKAQVIDIEAHCLQRAYPLIGEPIDSESDQVVAIVGIGATITTLNVLTGSGTPFNRDQLFGGNQLTEEIQRRYSLSFEDAELAKKQGGLPDDYEEEVLQPFKQTVAQQVMKTLQFFYSSSQYNSVDSIVLSGGSTSIDGLADEVAAKVGVPTSIANPVAGMAVSSKGDATALAEDAAGLMVACGLAMRSFD